MNRDNFTQGLFPENSAVFNLQDDNNNKIINESIILDILGDKKSLLEFYNHIGKFGARDGILNECAATDIKLQSVGGCQAGDASCILATAKESNDPDYDVYTKCIMLMSKCMENMKSKYGNIANERLEAQKNVVAENPRVQDAIDKVKENS